MLSEIYPSILLKTLNRLNPLKCLQLYQQIQVRWCVSPHSWDYNPRRSDVFLPRPAQMLHEKMPQALLLLAPRLEEAIFILQRLVISWCSQSHLWWLCCRYHHIMQYQRYQSMSKYMLSTAQKIEKWWKVKSKQNSGNWFFDLFWGCTFPAARWTLVWPTLPGASYWWAAQRESGALSSAPQKLHSGHDERCDTMAPSFWHWWTFTKVRNV